MVIFFADLVCRYRKPEPPAKGTAKVEQPAKENRKRQRRSKGSRTTRGKVSTPHRIQCLLAKSEFLGAGSFSLADNGSFATTGWEGVPPPERAREEIQELYASQPRARALYPWLRYFFPAEYKAKLKFVLLSAIFRADPNFWLQCS